MDNLKSDDQGLRELALFAGGGGGILGGKLLGWRTVCAVEIEEYARGILVRRQNEGHLEPFPIWSDVCTFDGRPWRGLVDVVSGGFPCQDISSAKRGGGSGLAGSRSGLWREMARIIGEVRPCFVFVENSPLLISRGLDVVLADLAAMGYDARWGIVGANDAGAPHVRKRIWILANANRAHRKRKKLPGRENTENAHAYKSSRVKAWRTDPADIPGSGVDRVVDGVANRVDRVKALGNGQVPAVVELAWKTLINL